MLCRGQPLTLVVNAGEQEGLLAWRSINEHFEPNVRTRQAGVLLNMLNWSLGGDVSARMELFEREVLAYQRKADEELSDTIRIGIVLRQLDESGLRQHLLLNSARMEDWATFKAEIINIRLAHRRRPGPSRWTSGP